MTIMRIYKKILIHFFLILYNPYILYFFYLRKKKSRSLLKSEQLKKLKKSLIYSYENIPFYKKCFDQYKFNPYVFSNQSQLEVLPILTKDIINDNIEMFKTIKPVYGCKVATTGGSTGTPFAYKMSIKNRQLGLAIRRL